jgi:DNA-binding CsgD family transcriptional regulator
MADEQTGQKQFSMALGGTKVREEVEFGLDGNIVTFVTSVERIEGFDLVVAVGHRKHPLIDLLTRREHEILSLLPLLDSSAILDLLALKRSTFDTHRTRMRDKLDCTNNAQLAAFAAIHSHNAPQ